MKTSLKRYSFLVVLASLLLCSGCPLRTDFPLGPGAKAPADPRLVGDWIFLEPKDADAGTAILSILAFNENEYYAEVREERKTDRYRVYITVVEGVSFLNIQEIEGDPSERTFLFCKFSVSGDELRLWVVDDASLPQKLTSTTELREYIRKNLDSPGLFDTPMRFRKKGGG